MKTILVRSQRALKLNLILLPILILGCIINTQTARAETGSFYDMKTTTLAGAPADLSQYKGQLALVVNVASRCGYTPQYKGLEEIYKKYKDRGFVILGFPSNDFHHQEPGSADEIQKFCSMNYGVTFPLFKKDPVSGDEKQEIYKYLVAHAPASESGEVKWNFEKFLVSPQGQVIERWRSKVEPDSEKITSAIEKNLPKSAEKPAAKTAQR